LYEWTADVANKLTHVNYAFATVTYSKPLDTYYVDSPDPWADMGDCMGVENCWGNNPACLSIEGEICGPNSNPTVNLAPSIAEVGGTCQSGCVNNGGSPISPRTPTCNANLNTFTHPSQPNTSSTGPATPTACGLYNHLLHPKNGVRAKYPHLRFIVSIGGWYDSNFFTAAVSPKYRANFVKSVVGWVKAFKWDGVDFDFEYPGFEHGGEPLPAEMKRGDPEAITDCSKDKCEDPGRVDDGKNYAAFLVELKTALKAEQVASKRSEEYIISIAGAAGQDKLEKQDVKSMCQSLSYVNIMTYDMHGSFDSQTNHQSPLYCKVPAGSKVDYCYSIDNAVEYYLSHGCTADQLHVGVPFYAHQYDQVQRGSDTKLPGLYQNFTGPTESICQSFPQQCVPTYKSESSQWAAHTYWDEASGASYAYDGSTFYSFDDKKSIATKATYLKNKKLGGFMYWFIGGDTTSNELLTALHNGLN
jgi:GH18 family chitinase